MRLIPCCCGSGIGQQLQLQLNPQLGNRWAVNRRNKKTKKKKKEMVLGLCEVATKTYQRHRLCITTMYINPVICLLGTYHVSGIWDTSVNRHLYNPEIPLGKKNGNHKKLWGFPIVVQRKQIQLVSVRMQVWSLASLRGLGIQRCRERCVSHRHGSDPSCCGVGRQLELQFDP